MTADPPSDTLETQPPVELPSHKAAVLVVDLVESVRAMARDEIGVIRRWQAFVIEVQQVVLPATSGRLVKSLGDGLMAEFPDARAALRAARSMHDWMANRCDAMSDGSHLILRAGIHASSVYEGAMDIYGTGVNLAARVTTLAAAGETVATVEACDQLTDMLDADVEDLGDCLLKHVDRPVRVYRLGHAQQSWSLPDRISYDADLFVGIAVLPFVDAFSTEAARGLGDVVADGVIGQLSQSAAMRVVSRLSSSRLRGHESLPEIAERLGVRYVLSGTYTVSGAMVTLSAELAEASGGHAIWAGRLHGDWRSLLHVDSELVHELAESVHRHILERAVSRAIVRPLPALGSYELFLAGITMMHRANAAEFEASRRLLESLTERHSRIALPYAYLGKWHVLQSIQGAVTDLPVASAMALSRTGRALDLEPSSALALAIEGFVYCHLRKDLATAELRLREALAINPSEGLAWLFLAVTLTFRGNAASALQAAQRALALSPIDPLRYYYESLMGSCAFGAGLHEEAVRWCTLSRRRNRKHLSTMRVLIAAYAELGQEEQARSVAAELLSIRPGYTVASYRAHSVAALFPFGDRIARAMYAADIP